MSDQENVALAFEKFRIVRKSLGYTQEEVAEIMQVRQRDISLLEKGGKKFFPLPYIQFLYNEFVDLNWFFNNKPLQAEDPYLTHLERRKYMDEEAKGRREELRLLETGYNYLSAKSISPGKGNVALVETASSELYPTQYADAGFIATLPAFHFPGASASYRIFQMAGDAMEPVVSQYEYLLTKKVTAYEDLVAGKAYVIVKDGKLLVRNVKPKGNEGTLVLTPENENYQKAEAAWTDLQEIWEVTMLATSYLKGGKK